MRRLIAALVALVMFGTGCTVPPIIQDPRPNPDPAPTTAPPVTVPVTEPPVTTVAPSTTVQEPAPSTSTTVQAPTPTTPPVTVPPTTPVTTVPPTTIPPTTTAPPAPAQGIELDPAPGPSPSGDDTGNFRTTCRPSHVLADDPIVFPGRPGASHLHQFWGNTSVTAASTTMMTGTSTCAGGAANRSGYWIPSVVDAQGRPIPAHWASIYYKSGYQGIRHEDIRYLPAGLRIISDQAWWSCSATGWQRSATIPACPAGARLIAHVNFPQCWDTVNLDSPSHRSHMAYGRAGGCPASHPYPIPEITINAEFFVPPGGTAGLSVSSDMGAPPGSTLHGDWWNGWDETVMRTFIDRCVRPGLDCHVDLLGDGTRLRWRN